LQVSDFLELLLQALQEERSHFSIVGNVLRDMPSLEDAYREYAKALNREVDSLTKAEQQQAYLNAVLKQGDENEPRT
jgi:hypothetical protein